MTLLELTVAMTIMMVVVGAMAALTRTAQQSFEYSEGYGVATQHARVVLDRIAQNVCQATANEQFPGCLVVAESVDGVSLSRYAGHLASHRLAGGAGRPAALQRVDRLLSESCCTESTGRDDGARRTPAPCPPLPTFRRGGRTWRR